MQLLPFRFVPSNRNEAINSGTMAVGWCDGVRTLGRSPYLAQHGRNGRPLVARTRCDQAQVLRL